MQAMNEETATILIDTALAAGAASALDPEERRLQELVLAIRDDAPAPEPDFALRMNARVAAGFPSRRRTRGGALRTLITTRPQLTALGAAASLLVAVLVAVAIGNGGGSQDHVARIVAPDVAASGGDSAGSASSASGTSTGSGTSRSEAAPATKAIAPQSSNGIAVPQPSPVPPGGFVGGRARKIERSASLVLAPARDKVSDVGDQVVAVTDRYHGFVQESSVTSSSGQGGGGSFDLRIPVRNLQPALRDLSGLADVKSRTENADDVTASFVNARTRLEELTADRRGLLRRLAHATTDDQAASIRSRIKTDDAQIGSQHSQLAELRRRTGYATVSVTLEPKQSGAGGGTGIGSGARDLRDSLVDSVNVALRVLGVALPIALVIALLWGGSGLVTRRRREAALD